MHTLYTLTPGEADALSNLDQSDVIATGPWVKGEMSVPHRAVLRDLGHELVIHTQGIADGRAYYVEGRYIRKDESDPWWFGYAWTHFENRARTVCGIEQSKP